MTNLYCLLGKVNMVSGSQLYAQEYYSGICINTKVVCLKF